jgi:hypothetical protein
MNHNGTTRSVSSTTTTTTTVLSDTVNEYIRAKNIRLRIYGLDTDSYFFQYSCYVTEKQR